MASSPPSPWVYFLAGAMLPSIAYYFLSNRRGGDNSQDEEEEDSVYTIDGKTPTNTFSPSSQWGLKDAPFKMVLVVNQELKMGKGKMSAQCCHAAVGCYKRARKQCPAALQAWERTGCAKITVKCPTQTELEEIAVRALERDMPVYLVEDAGRTQIAAGSRTVLGIGPAPESTFVGVSNHLSLM